MARFSRSDLSGKKRHFIQEIKLNGLNFMEIYISKSETIDIVFILFVKVRSLENSVRLRRNASFRNSIQAIKLQRTKQENFRVII
jgi:hypothetical protein